MTYNLLDHFYKWYKENEFFDIDVDDINKISDNRFEVYGTMYLMVDEFEVDTELYNFFQGVADDEVNNIPEYLRKYFDKDSFIEDCINDIKANSDPVYVLSCDNVVREYYTDDGEFWYIYRVN